MRKQLVWMAVLVLGLVLAQAVQRQLALSVNGKSSSAKAIVVNGQSYVPLSALRELGIGVNATSTSIALSSQTAGGANGRVSLEGCLNELLFNGIWRVRATKVEQIEAIGRKVWAVTLEVRNGTDKTLEPGQTGWRDSSGLTLAFADNSTGTIEASALARDYANEVYYAKIPQGASVISQIKFDLKQTEAPTKLLVQIDPNRLQRNLGVSYTTPDPSFRFKLDCTQ